MGFNSAFKGLNIEAVVSFTCRLYSFKQDGKRVINFEWERICIEVLRHTCVPSTIKE